MEGPLIIKMPHLKYNILTAVNVLFEVVFLFLFLDVPYNDWEPLVSHKLRPGQKEVSAHRRGLLSVSL